MLVKIIKLIKNVSVISAEYCRTTDADILVKCVHGCCGTESARVCCTVFDYTWLVAVSVTLGVLAVLAVVFGVYYFCNRNPRLKIQTYLNKPPNVGSRSKLF